MREREGCNDWVVSRRLRSSRHRAERTCVEEGGDGHAAHQVLQEQTLSGDQDGHEGGQGVVERQVADLGNKNVSVKAGVGSLADARMMTDDWPWEE